MKSLFKIRARPKLNAPDMLAAWPGVGDVAMIVAGHLLKELDFKELGELEASYFFEPIGIIVKDSLVEAPSFPQSRFYYWKNRAGGKDLIIFIGDDQPPAKAYELAQTVLDVGARFQVGRVYTCAAALTRMHHTESPRVWGAATDTVTTDGLKQYGLMNRGNFQIAGLNGLLLGVAKERDIEAVCLLGEVPNYASQIQNPMAALAVLNVLSRVLGLSLDTTDLARVAAETNAHLKQVAAEAMGNYIDYLTMPIWEQGEDGEEDEEEEED
jgi:proteasome assembly chaperone (PAC2) family protein